MSALHALRRARRGTAALEFALLTPLLLAFLGGVTDFGLVTIARSQLANAVAQGAQYAILTGTDVSPTTIKTLVQKASPLNNLTATVTPAAGAACYCISGSPLALVSATCTATCPDGTAPGEYLTISATYTYNPIMPFYSKMASTTLTEKAQVRIQ